jgi:cytochrome c5
LRVLHDALCQYNSPIQSQHPEGEEDMAYTAEQKSRTTRAVIWIVAGTIALILGIYMLAQIVVGSHATQAIRETQLMSEQAVAERLAPVGKATVDPNAPVSPAPAASSTPAPAAETQATSAPASAAATAGAAVLAAATPASGDKGKETYDAVCAMCHKDGIAGAPKVGDKVAWEPRVAQGADTLHANALKGKGVMPAKGGRLDLPDDDVKAAVDYMVAQAK